MIIDFDKYKLDVHVEETKNAYVEKELYGFYNIGWSGAISYVGKKLLSIK